MKRQAKRDKARGKTPDQIMRDCDKDFKDFADKTAYQGVCISDYREWAREIIDEVYR